jgi:tetratricopeptide (TPR) repeat protein
MAAVGKALQLEPEFAEAHTILAGAHQQAWQWADAEAAYLKALRRNPDSSAAHVGLGSLLLWRGRTDEGLAHARRGRDADPLSVTYTVRLGWLLYHARRYDDAIREFRTVLSAHPDHRSALWFLGFALIEVLRIDEAIATLERLSTLWNRNPAALGVLARAYARAGRRAAALDLVHELKEREAAGYVPPAVFINAYIGLGDYERAFASLERAYIEQSNIMMFLGTHPLFDPIRTDRRFRNLLDRVGLGP